MTYDAFISYAHGADDQLAAVLQRALSHFAKPWYRRRALRVFLDERALSANPGLWATLSETLDDSQWFVLLASLEAAESEWVNREIEHWLTAHRADHLLAVVTAGDWEWDQSTADFKWQQSSAVPPALRNAYAEEPLYVDLRWARDEDALSEQHPRFRDAVASLAAPIHGVQRDEIEGQDVREHRRTVRTVRAVGVVLVLLTIAAVVGAYQSVGNSRRADAARADSDFRRVVAEARDLRFSNPELAALLAVEAWHQRNTPLSRGALQAVLLGDARFLGTRVDHDRKTGYRSLCVVADGGGRSIAIAGGDDGSLTFVDPTGGTPTVRVDLSERGQHVGTVSCAANHAGDVVAFSDAGRVWAVNLAARSATGTLTIGNAINDIAVSPDGKAFAAGTSDGKVLVWSRDGPVSQILESGPGAAAVAFSPDGATLMSTAYDALVAWDTHTWTERGRYRDSALTQSGGVVRVRGRHIDFSGDGRSLVETRRAMVQMFDVASGVVRWSRTFDLGYPSPAVFATDSASVFVDAPAEGIEQLDATTGQQLEPTLHSTEAFGDLLAVTADGATLVAASFGRPALGVWALDGRSLIGRLLLAPSHAHPSYSPEGRALLVQASALDLASPGTVYETATGRLIASVPSATLPKLVDDHTVSAFFAERSAIERLDLTTGQRTGPTRVVDRLDRFLLTAASDNSGHA